MKLRLTRSLRSSLLIAAAATAITFVSGEPRLSSAATRAMPWVPGRIACGDAGRAFISISSETSVRVKLPLPAVFLENKGSVEGMPFTGIIFSYFVSRSSLHATQHFCSRALSRPGTVGVHQTGILRNHQSVACRFAGPVQVQGRWLGRPYTTVQLLFAAGASTRALAVVTLNSRGTHASYDPRLCGRVPFKLGHNFAPPPAAATTDTTTDATGTDTVPGP